MTKSLLLDDVPKKSYFNLKDGRVLRGVEDLRLVLKDIEPKVLSKHIKGEKNEFATWVDNCVRDSGLAKGLYRAGADRVKARKVIDNWMQYVMRKHKVKLKNRAVLVCEDVRRKGLYKRRLTVPKERKVVRAENVRSLLRVLKNG